MTALARIIDALEPDGAGWRGAIPATWLQGRTAYGGLSTALALAVDPDRCSPVGGVLTPAVTMGDVLIDRLRAQGFTVQVEPA